MAAVLVNTRLAAMVVVTLATMVKVAVPPPASVPHSSLSRQVRTPVALSGGQAVNATVGGVLLLTVEVT